MIELFANPAYLAAGTALVSSPVIIHLINRMRFKRLRWAAMEFLLKSQKRNRRRLIIEQLLLLLMRCFLVFLAMLLVSRFFGFSFAADQGKDLIHIVLLDDSLSMNDQFKEGENARNCFDVAKNSELFDKIVKNLSQSNRNDRLMILPLSKLVTDRNYEVKTYTRLGDKEKREALKSDLDQLEVSKLHVSVLPGLKKAQEIMSGNPESRIAVYVLSDFRQSDWSMPGAEPIKKEFLNLASGPDTKIFLRDCAHPLRVDGQGVPLSHDNIGIVDLRPGTRIAGKGMPVSFTVTIANYSAREADVNVVIFDDSNGREMLQLDFNPSMPLKIAAGSTASATFEVPFDPPIKANESYFAQISAHLENPQRGKLENDGLPDDNVRTTAVEIRNKVPVLVVDGEGARGRDESRDSFFIKNAIMSVPGASYDVVYGDEIAGGVATKALERADLSQYPTIFMLNVRELTPKQLANLENYTREGGGVAFFLGPLVDATYYNKNLYRKGKGLFPTPLSATYFPPAADEPRKSEYNADDYHVLLRDTTHPNPESFPIFGQVFRDPKFRVFLKDLPIKRYFQVPRSEWKPDKSKVEELATLPNDVPIQDYQGTAVDLLRKLAGVLKNEEYKPYQTGLDRHRKVIESLVGPTSEKKAFHLAGALESMITDKGKEKERDEYPNLTEFWTTSDPKVRTLRDEIVSLIDQVKYGDPFVVLGNYGKGKVIAVTTTAGKEWNDWGGGSQGSLIYQPFIWEMQNFLSSQAVDSYLTVGTPVQITVDAEQYKQKNRQLKMERYFMKAVAGKPAVQSLDSEQFGEQEKGELRFTFDKNLEPGLYVAKLVPEGGKSVLASWSHVFNVDTPREGRLQRVSRKEMDSNLLDEARPGSINFAPAGSGGEDPTARQSDLSESPWFFLLFLGILIAEQALAVHLSFHLRSSEGELPTATPARAARAA